MIMKQVIQVKQIILVAMDVHVV